MSRPGPPLPRILDDALGRAALDPPSLATLAKAAGVEVQTLYSIRCGARRMTPAIAEKIGKVLGLPPDIVAPLFSVQGPR